MNKVKLMFVANQNVTNETLHALYTSIRFKNEKYETEEDVKIWSEGRSVFIVIDQDKIENLVEQFSFITFDKKEIKLKLMRNQKLNLQNNFKSNEYVSLFGVLSHSRKHFLNNENGKKEIEYCVLDVQSRFKKGTKKDFLNYLTRKTGLDFIEAEKNKEVIFERIITDENEIYNKSLSKKVAIRNVIAVNANKIKIIDEEKANELFFKQIGKRKTYGLGNFTLEKLI